MTIAKTDSRRFFTISILMALVLVCFYIFQVVKLTEAGYLRGERESLIRDLKKETAELKLAVSKDRNLVNIEEKVSEEGFQKINKLNYIVVPDNSLAAK
jgi:ATP-dependent protease HslVU (ClpYQ) ATPase subunit